MSTAIIDGRPMTDYEARVVRRLRAIKMEDGGAGHGTLRVEITAGEESLIKREFSERLPRLKK